MNESNEWDTFEDWWRKNEHRFDLHNYTQRHWAVKAAAEEAYAAGYRQSAIIRQATRDRMDNNG